MWALAPSLEQNYHLRVIEAARISHRSLAGTMKRGGNAEVNGADRRVSDLIFLAVYPSLDTSLFACVFKLCF